MTPNELDQHRKALGFTAEGFSAHIGVSKVSYHRWTSGAVPIPKIVALYVELLRTTKNPTE